MQNSSGSMNIDLTPEYQKNLKYLAKKYRRIRSDITEEEIRAILREYPL